MAAVDINPSVPRTPFPQRYEALTAEDFETASIRSAAPSYISEAPSYQSQNVPNEPAPPYTPRENSTTPTPTRRVNPAAQRPSRTSGPAFIPPPYGLTISPTVEISGYGSTSSATAVSSSTRDRANSESPAPTGLPPIPPVRAPVPGVPNLTEFRIPTIAANPSARHYVRVAQRRAQAAADAADAGFAMRMLLERVEEEESRRFRPLEDPYLVGEAEARRARERRVAREEGIIPSDHALEREGRRWDWLLGQVREWDERDRRSSSPGGPFGEGGRPRKHRGRLGIFGRR